MLPPRSLGTKTFDGHNTWDGDCVQRADNDPDVTGERCKMCRPVAVEAASAAVLRELGS